MTSLRLIAVPKNERRQPLGFAAKPKKDSSFLSKPLVTSDNRWAPRCQSLDSDSSRCLEKAVLRSVNSLVNKLSDGNLDRIQDKFRDLEVGSMDLLGKIADATFAKAISEPGFAAVYARFFCGVSAISYHQNSTLGTELSALCLVEAGRSDPVRGDRRRALGFCHLLAALFREGFSTEAQINSYVFNLFDAIEPESPDEEAMEVLLRFLLLAAPTLAAHASTQLGLYFLVLAEMRANPKLSTRLRFMLDDVLATKARVLAQRDAAAAAADRSDASSVSSDDAASVESADEEPLPATCRPPVAALAVHAAGTCAH